MKNKEPKIEKDYEKAIKDLEYFCKEMLKSNYRHELDDYEMDDIRDCVNDIVTQSQMATTSRKRCIMNHEEKLEKRTIKDSVFTNLFSDKKYLLQLYQSLHPEDLEATEDDLTAITLKNVLTNQIYNDLGFAKGDRLIILLECQSKWTENIILRILLYIAETYQ